MGRRITDTSSIDVPAAMSPSYITTQQQLDVLADRRQNVAQINKKTYYSYPNNGRHTSQTRLRRRLPLCSHVLQLLYPHGSVRLCPKMGKKLATPPFVSEHYAPSRQHKNHFQHGKYRRRTNETRMKNIATILLSTLMLSACGLADGNNGKTPIDQSKLCIFSNDEDAKHCKPGELAMFRPDFWGNEQLPLNVAAIYCDFNHQVMYNVAGVICVFTDERLHLLAEDSSPPSDVTTQKEKKAPRQIKNSGNTYKSPENRPRDNSPMDPRIAKDIISRSREMLALNESIQQNALIKHRNGVHITASTREARYANYMRDWVHKVERVGQLNYPDAARRQGLSGKLIMEVAVLPDGSVRNITILKPTGNKILDDAAVRIVKLAAPFAPFPENIRKDSDILYITRTWTFYSNNSFRTRP